ncbi:hypothetical protein E1B28_007684 [Marasmius oreades]|uniref:Peptide hydrolase n=1 Tax=Marasmius oreades TaxID=181124 RepID=A0A9P7S282_9AGAR|nr:uncharacterized protein E1B28_007684 [Marasmius oreades]KAG7094064.1 hypothetical protein E1B28_007684 [Marasmius oreades]
MRLQVFLALAALQLVNCAPISHDEILANVAKNLRLLSLEDGADPVWKTEVELMRAGKHFFDVTETYELEQNPPAVENFESFATYPSPSHQTRVKPILSTISVSNMESSLSSLTAFNNRYYRSSTGADASNWILSKVKSITLGRSDITASLFTHSWVQSSVIVKIAGTTASSPVTILGSHLDSINLNNPTSGRAPGADDDGTGTVNLIEILRALVASGYKPSTPLEFHWYSGEEAGLLGSQAIATSYANSRVNVKAFIQLDMTGYFKPGSKEVIALETDYIDAGLNTFLRSIIGSYSSLPVANDTPCGYACSDHASWYKAGYPTAFPFEAVTGNDSPVIHTSSDTTAYSGFSWSHSLEFAKVALAAAYELTV